MNCFECMIPRAATYITGYAASSVAMSTYLAVCQAHTVSASII